MVSRPHVKVARAVGELKHVAKLKFTLLTTTAYHVRIPADLSELVTACLLRAGERN